MPAPKKKISSHNEEQGCGTSDSSDPCKKKCDASVTKITESQAKLSKEPCANKSDACQMARPNLSATGTRDKDKPGCVDYEFPETPKDDATPNNSNNNKNRCGIDYEDCDDLKKEEKRRLKEKKEAEKREKKNKK